MTELYKLTLAGAAATLTPTANGKKGWVTYQREDISDEAGQGYLRNCFINAIGLHPLLANCKISRNELTESDAQGREHQTHSFNISNAGAVELEVLKGILTKIAADIPTKEALGKMVGVGNELATKNQKTPEKILDLKISDELAPYMQAVVAHFEGKGTKLDQAAREELFAAIKAEHPLNRVADPAQALPTRAREGAARG